MASINWLDLTHTQAIDVIVLHVARNGETKKQTRIRVNDVLRKMSGRKRKDRYELPRDLDAHVNQDFWDVVAKQWPPLTKLDGFPFRAVQAHIVATGPGGRISATAFNVPTDYNTLRAYYLEAQEQLRQFRAENAALKARATALEAELEPCRRRIEKQNKSPGRPRTGKLPKT